MKQYDNNNSGVLFKNDKEGNPKRPDYKGHGEIQGVEYWLSAWVKESQNGKKYMSLSFTLKDPNKDREYKTPKDDDSGGLPF